jgi:pimeloyl-ACP methyl ester carboxylesterase
MWIYDYVEVPNTIQSNVDAHIIPAAGTVLSTDYNWESSLSDSNLSTSYSINSIGFDIFAVSGSGYYEVDGEGDPTSITVSGQPATNPGGPLSAVNPYALYAPSKLAPPTLDLPTVLSSPAATGLAADGKSALVLTYQSTSNEPVTFSVSASDTAVGTLAPFDPDYLVSPNPSAGSSESLSVSPYSCDQFGNCTFLALLWGPASMPSPDTSPAVVNLTVTAAQPSVANPPSYAVELVPPPLLLVHGIWDDATNAWATPGTGGFYDWIYTQYPDPVNLISAVDYGFGPPACLTCSPGEPLSAKEFDDPQIQSVFENTLDSAIASAASAGIAARTVDVVAHSMGGLVTRYYMTNSESAENPALLANPIHKLITIGTPHLGTNLATVLYNNRNTTTVLADLNPEVDAFCSLLQVCTVQTVFSLAGLPIDTGVASLEPGSPQIAGLSSSTPYNAIVGESPSPISLTEGIIDAVILAFIPPQTISSILDDQKNDVVVPIGSQAPSCGILCVTVPDVVHTGMFGFDCDEKHNEIVWEWAFYWLTGGVEPAPPLSIPIPPACNDDSDSSDASIKGNALGQGTARSNTLSGSGPPPTLTLTGDTQVAASNVAITPASGTTLTIGNATSITATSTTKTITEVLLLQGVADPTDRAAAYATQSPFTIAYTPTRLGTATFSAITVFSDNTFALTTLTYPLQTTGSPGQLTLADVPAASLQIGGTTVVQASAQFLTGSPVNVTQVATYTTQSGTAKVFSIGSGGVVTANGTGEDQLNVFYGGLTASAVISVGACTYSLGASSQIVSYDGGTVDIGVAAPAGCNWTATGGSSWLTFTNASGAGSGTITLTAAANTTGSAQSATVNLGNAYASVQQPATACTYGLSPTQINALPAGASGTISVTTSCPVVVSSNASWVTASVSGSSVSYTVLPNTGTAQRTATLTIGTQAVPVVQPTAVIVPYLEVNGGVWQESADATVNYGSTVNLGPQPVSGGTWSWTGPGEFTSTSRQINGIPLDSGTNAFTATYTTTAGVASTETFTITIAPTTITPYLEVNGGAWQATNNIAVAPGSTLNLGPQAAGSGTWSWSGPGFTASTRQVNDIPLNSASNVYTATFTSAAGVTSTETFTITIAPTTITPYLEVNGGAWQGTNSVTVPVGSAVNLGPQAAGSGTWSWSGPSYTASTRQVNNVPLTSANNVYTATFTNAAGVTSTETFTITIAPTTITPYLEVNGGAWQATNNIAVAPGSTVNLGPQAAGSGTWSWSGPGFTSSAQQVNNVPLTSASNVYTATFTNAAGVISTETFTITVAPTAITPYLEVNGGAWQATNSVTVAAGSSVNLGPQASGSGTWSWSGPSFTASTSQVNNVPLTSASNIYTATFTNAAGVRSTETFTITIAPTTITPYLQDYEQDGGAWQATANLTANYSDTVNLGPQAAGSGTWSWSGPGFTSSAQQVNNIPLNSPSNVYTASFTNAAGVISTETFTITVAPTTITPYIEVNNGAWQGTNSVTVAAGSTVNLGPQPGSGGSWSWAGPNGYEAGSRQINGIPLSVGSNSYVATYTNPAGVMSTETFTITVE